MQDKIQAMAQQFGVDAGALACLLTFMQDKLSKPEARELFLSATDSQRDEIVRSGVVAWRDLSERTLLELAANETEWAQEANRQIAADVWRTVRTQKGLPC